jgi:hypothetical protein
MLGSMSQRLTVSLPDDLADAVREAAGGNLSSYTARALKSALLRAQIPTLPSPDADWVALAEDSRGW